MISAEYIRLKNIKTGKELSFVPNKEFNIPNGDYININYARVIKDGKDMFLRAGEKVSIGENEVLAQLIESKTNFKTKAEVKEYLNSRGIGYPTKATFDELKELANATIR